MITFSDIDDNICQEAGYDRESEESHREKASDDIQFVLILEENWNQFLREYYPAVWIAP